MTIESTNDNKPTNPAITYSECYAQVFSRLFLGDCLIEMDKITDKSVDLILTDLPYGTTQCKWDSIIDLDLLWRQYKRVIKDNGTIVLFAAQPFTSILINSNIKMFKYCWVWDKIRASNFFAAKFQPLNNTEDIVVFSNGGANNGAKMPMMYNPQGMTIINKEVKNSNSVGGKIGDAHKTAMKRGENYIQEGTGYPNKILQFIRDNDCVHPTQKPTALLEYLIRTYTDEKMIVLDSTMGSGSAGVACKNTNRSFIGIEKDENYFKIAEQRINARTLFS